MASLAFDELVYAGHPYSRPEDGYPETIRLITRQTCFHFTRSILDQRGWSFPSWVESILNEL